MGSFTQLVDYTHQRIFQAFNVAIKSKSALVEPIYVASGIDNGHCLRAVEARCSTGSVLVGDLAYEDSRVVRAVNALDNLHKSWLMYCHLDTDANWQRLSVITLWLYEKVLDDLKDSGRVMRKKSLKRLEGLCLLIVQTHQCGASKKYGVTELANLLQVEPSHFDRDWRAPLNLIQARLKDLDEAAVGCFWQQISVANSVI